MRTFENYYDRDLSLKETVKSLADPQLCFERDRETVNELVMNLVIKFSAKYLGIQDNEPRMIKEAANIINATDFNDILLSLQQGINNVNNGSFIYQRDTLAQECLLDIRSTAAIVKEIIFNDQFQKTNSFMGVDFGAGSGILMLASLLAAMRQEIQRRFVFGIELQREAVAKAQKVLESIFDSSEFTIGVADITNLETMMSLANFNLSHWVSETIAWDCPEIIISDSIVQIQTDVQGLVGVQINKTWDPFPIIVKNACATNPNFPEDVQNGQTAMFPDIMNGLYQPNPNNPQIILRTGPNNNPIKLDQVGDEFANFEDFEVATKRWRAPDTMPEEDAEFISKLCDILVENM